MTAADLAYVATQVAEVLAWIALACTPGLLIAGAFHCAKQAVARRAWAASCRPVADEYRQDEPLLDDVAAIVDAYADRIAPLYGTGE